MAEKSIEQPIRVGSLEYLSIVAARLRKDIIESRCKMKTRYQLINYIKIEQRNFVLLYILREPVYSKTE